MYFCECPLCTAHHRDSERCKSSSNIGNVEMPNFQYLEDIIMRLVSHPLLDELETTKEGLYKRSVNTLPLPPPQGTIPLPALSNVPVTLNPLLRYREGESPTILYELSSPPSSAILNIPIRHAYPISWLNQPAIILGETGSMTIRLYRDEKECESRPIVVFPSSTHCSTVKVIDVLLAVQQFILKFPQIVKGCHQSHVPQRMHWFSGAQYSSLCGDAMIPRWKGLYPSDNERDVWILDIT